MKTKLFDDPNLTQQQIIDNLEAENCGVEESHTFVKPFTEDELVQAESDYLEKSKSLDVLEKELQQVSAPLKEEMKPLKLETKKLISMINKGGEEVTEKVFCFPDYDNKVMGLYDKRGIHIGTRPMTRAERQLHINSHKQIAVNG
jgi:hypothetical protein